MTLEKDSFIPTFIGIGAEKSGTTWCWKTLDDHPNISMAHPKELNFFNNNYARGKEWYLNHFLSSDSKITGEISPLYMDDPFAADRIAKNFPSAIILVILRNPWDRSISNLLHEIKYHYGKISNIDTTIAINFAKQDDKYIRRSLYYQALTPYFEVFDKEQMKIIFFDDLINDSRNIAKTLYSSVGANAEYIPSTVDRQINKSRDYRSYWLFSLMRSLSQQVKSNPSTRDILELVHRHTNFRERVLELLKVDSKNPELNFEEIFGIEASLLIQQDVEQLGVFGISIPQEWSTSVLRAKI